MDDHEIGYRRYEQRFAAARLVLHAAAAQELPLPRLVGGISPHELADDLSLYFTESGHAHAWAEWLGVLLIERIPGVWTADGEKFEQPLHLSWTDDARRLHGLDVALVPLVRVGASS